MSAPSSKSYTLLYKASPDLAKALLNKEDMNTVEVKIRVLKCAPFDLQLSRVSSIANEIISVPMENLLSSGRSIIREQAVGVLEGYQDQIILQAIRVLKTKKEEAQHEAYSLTLDEFSNHSALGIKFGYSNGDVTTRFTLMNPNQAEEFRRIENPARSIFDACTLS